MVFVLDENKKPLSPCKEAKAKKLLKQGKAVTQRADGYKYFAERREGACSL